MSASSAPTSAPTSQATPRPLLLLSNDDGHRSTGLRTLRDALSTFADVVIVAPESEQSATSHALTLARPLRLRPLKPPHPENAFSVDGTPADCVYVALHSRGRILTRRPDLVVSGINRGLNLGQDVFYSGTVAAAREGALRGIPALAVSAHVDADLDRVAQLASKIVRELLAHGPHHPPLLNLNVPAGWNGEVRGTRLGQRIYEEVVEFRSDPRGREYLWLGGPGVRHERSPGTDTDAYDDGAASLTSLILDLTLTADAPLVLEICRKVQ